MKRMLFAVSSLGLGHATRTLPIINHYKKDYNITIVSYGNALEFLKVELSKDENIDFVSIEDYPKFGRGKGIDVYFNLIVDAIRVNFIINKEKKYLKGIEDDYELVFSDGRYGFNSRKIPSFLLSHQISLILPKYLELFKRLVEGVNCLYIDKFDKLFIADYNSKEESLAGDLSHMRYLEHLNHEYVGILSSYEKTDVQCDIDYLFVISGYLKDNRNSFVASLIEESKKLDGKKVFVLGDMSSTEVREIEEHNIIIYPSIAGEMRNELFNRAKVVVSRNGYTTIMDLVELNKKAIMFPTPNQGEQEYLATLGKLNRHFVIEDSQKQIDLVDLANRLKDSEGFEGAPKTRESLNKIKDSVASYERKSFFSVIIPAHNEEELIGETLEKLESLDYPKDSYEVIVVENGSKDATYSIALEYKKLLPNLRVYQSGKGVSVARNRGKELISKRSDWTVFLDADTVVRPKFLSELNTYLNRNENKNLSVGTCAIEPSDSKSLYAKAWFKGYDIAHKLSHTSYSIQIAKSSIAKDIDYDEDLHYSEDLKYIKDMKKHGEFFFLDTKEIATSTRRFEKYGYLGLTCIWVYQSLLPKKLKKNKRYKAVRNL